MIITKETVGEKISAYLQGTLSQAELVKWAEDAFFDDDVEFAKHNENLIRDILGHLGAADVKQFGLTWEDCKEYLHALGFSLHVELEKS